MPAEWEATRHESDMSISAAITVRTNNDAVSHQIVIWCDTQEVEDMLRGFGSAVEHMARRIVREYVPVATATNRSEEK